ncbi:hypothetical protein PR202_gb11758 [Eleusine coracana subsp. coracana]|uniref:Uncharacterized protein n=1 Tax=Eleusine coracana subsp. coracana TaxID=191504 RepID=A0AAV5EMI3_ELECO|nr:hypothetical protein PR202_gb11758 [Eleusine coracana subsp. coracana]
MMLAEEWGVCVELARAGNNNAETSVDAVQRVQGCQGAGDGHGGHTGVGGDATEGRRGPEDAEECVGGGRRVVEDGDARVLDSRAIAVNPSELLKPASPF